MSFLDGKCAYTKCKRQAKPENQIKTSIGNYYYCDFCWLHVKNDIKKPGGFNRPQETRPNYLFEKSQRYQQIHGR